MLVLAFDGVLFDTIGARGLAVCEALVAEGLDVGEEAARDAVAGRSLPEAVRFLAQRAATVATSRRLDETSLDVATLRANQAYAEFATRGFALHVSARDFLLRSASLTRIVLRADSRRREVDALLSLSGLELAASMTRCSDDPAPRLHRIDSAIGEDVSPARHFSDSITRSYQSITQRLAQNSGMLGEPVIGVAIEAGALGRLVATEAGFDTADDISSMDFPGR